MCQRTFAVVWWYKTDDDQDYFGKPAQVWIHCHYEPCGPALFMPVQPIRQKFACCSMKLGEVKKLVISPINVKLQFRKCQQTFFSQVDWKGNDQVSTQVEIYSQSPVLLCVC